MGSYSELLIGDYSLGWKHHVPSYLFFLFSDQDFYYHKGDPGCFTRVGYKTTVGESLERLAAAGFGKSFFCSVFDTLKSDLVDDVKESLRYDIAESIGKDSEDAIVQEKVQEYLASNQLPPTPDIAADFLKFIKAAGSAVGDRGQPGRSTEFKSSNGSSYPINPEAHELTEELITLSDTLGMFFLGKSLRFPPWILMANEMLSYDLGVHYEEAYNLMVFWVLLEVSVESAEVCLEVGDLEFNEEDGRRLLTRLRFELTRKITLYDGAFGDLLKRQDAIKESYARAECGRLLATIGNTQDSYAKGLELEKLVELLFSVAPGLDLQGKRVNLGDEELDLQYRNNVDRPFWIGFSSPMLLVECKNWSNRVGASAIRDFEGKLRNHPTARIGFFVAANGFTSEVSSALQRQSREDYSIFLLTTDDISDYCESGQKFFDWIESKMAVLH